MSTSTGQVALWKDVGRIAALAAIVAPLIGLALYERDRRDGRLSTMKSSSLILRLVAGV